MRAAVALGLLLAVGAVTGVLVVRSGWFRERVRARIVREIENATGGRVEIGSFTFDWQGLVASVSPLVIHGTEPAGEEPLLRADSVSVGLRIISALERKVDLAFLRVDRPRLRIAVYQDGSTNLPSPRGRNNSDWARSLVDLAVRRYSILNGVAEVDFRRFPLDLRGEDLRVQMDYDARTPRYPGHFESRRMRVTSAEAAPAEFDAAADFSLERDRIAFSRVKLATGRSRIDLAGAINSLRAPSGTFSVKAAVALRDVDAMIPLPVSKSGSAAFDGNLEISFANGFDYVLSGRGSARGIGYTYQRLKIENASASAELNATPERVTLRGLNVAALGSQITGEAQLGRDRSFHFSGRIEDLGLREAANVLTGRPIAWSGDLSGTVTVDANLGRSDAMVAATAAIAPAPGGTPVEGRVEIAYDQRAGTIRLGDSRVSTPATNINVSGTLGQILDLRARSTNLDDILPALAMLDASAPQTLPVRLNGGEAAVNGTVSGRLDDPQFRGEATLTKAIVEGHLIDRFTSAVEANRSGIVLRRMSLSRGAMTIGGEGSAVARNGSFEDAALTASLNLRNAPLPELGKEFGLTEPLAGTASASVGVTGTLRDPQAVIQLDVSGAAAFGERFDRVRAGVRYTARAIEVENGEADISSRRSGGVGKLLFSASFAHPESDWKNGDVVANIISQNVSAASFAAWRTMEPDAQAKLDGKLAIDARIERGAAVLRSLNGDLSAKSLALFDEPLGDVSIHGETHGSDLSVHASGDIRNTTVQAQGTWRLAGDLPGSGTITISRMSMVSLRDLVMLGGTAEQKRVTPPFDGYLQGSATFRVALRKPESFEAEAHLETVEVTAKASQALRLGAQAQDVTIRNTQPVIFSISAHEARIRSAQFAARNTSLEISGNLPFDTRTGADLSVKGSVNLAALQLLNPDLLAKGTATVNASVRGSLRDPVMNGRMELSGASLYLGDLPNGADDAAGLILFDRNRATIDHLTADTGGGTVSFGGFLEFGDPLIYRLRANVKQVRVRYPEDVSMTANADLALNGTSEASILSGSLTLNRAAISPSADFGRLLALTANSAPAPTSPNEYLRGMRFDVRIESSPTFELETSLTRNVQAEVDLRLRGTPVRPVLAGNVSVNSGEIQIFGNRYTVNRGDIRFLNPVQIEPTLDVNLETHARGITVNVSLAGTPQRLNVNYSSDPPLQSREIIALLAVGRDPTTAARFADTQLSSGISSSDAGGILGQAVSQQLSNRLQRFFGASRVKIDPTLTGVSNLPEARLTLEQQVSQNVTLTYITDLNQTQEQIVRVQWDLSQRWSAVAVRDSNGMFGIDIQYRKRFR